MEQVNYYLYSIYNFLKIYMLKNIFFLFIDEFLNWINQIYEWFILDILINIFPINLKF